ncbi:N-acetylmuramoyl-L-alanine amidase [Schnuerera sp. xch1]|uniref:N-acetylmuramoyl-L-alanine amidase family protein n=1 Tax=Schnuerera sp. xch1 TaxID=2874283 RepID=UPI001CBAFEA2|nr:N-acetylmuramoyl-L-alanine amidase [Schnuerera sp. xch1]MBZ2175468.1 N-acetylmuramoyl-L-alanine amidase [Schnuerera sp. xch1]
MKNKFRIYTIKLNRRLLLLIGFMVIFLIAIFKLRDSQVLDIFNFSDKDIIVVDPGHGGIDGGAGKKSDILEKDINLGVSLKLKKELLVEGFHVIMTRENDESLEDLSSINSSRYRKDLDARRNIINNNKPLVFISIHCNSSTRSSARGIKIYHYPNSVEGEELAKNISESIDRNFYYNYFRDDNLKCEILCEDFFILRETEYPGVLVEVGFITNPEERRLLQDDEYQQKLARAIKKGILSYLQK